METCYKVVKKDNLRYYFITSKELEYVLGTTITAPVISSENEFINTDFFVFKELQDAENFIKPFNRTNYDILVCRTDRLRKINFVTEIDPFHIKNYWKKNHGNYVQRNAPTGTYCCRTLFICCRALSIQSPPVYTEPKEKEFAEVFCETLNELLKTHPLTINSLLSSRVYIDPKTVPIKFRNLTFNNTLNVMGIINYCLEELEQKNISFKRVGETRQDLIDQYFIEKI